MNLSPAGYSLVSEMLSHLSPLKYGYKETVSGCLSYLIENCGMEMPDEDKQIIVDYVIERLEK